MTQLDSLIDYALWGTLQKTHVFTDPSGVLVKTPVPKWCQVEPRNGLFTLWDSLRVRRFMGYAESIGANVAIWTHNDRYGLSAFPGDLMAPGEFSLRTPGNSLAPIGTNWNHLVTVSPGESMLFSQDSEEYFQRVKDVFGYHSLLWSDHEMDKVAFKTMTRFHQLIGGIFYDEVADTVVVPGSMSIDLECVTMEERARNLASIENQVRKWTNSAGKAIDEKYSLFSWQEESWAERKNRVKADLVAFRKHWPTRYTAESQAVMERLWV